jgi:hypothetical protein
MVWVHSFTQMAASSRALSGQMRDMDQVFSFSQMVPYTRESSERISWEAMVSFSASLAR